MAFVGFLGRLAFAFLFISSGLQKLQTFDKMTGGPLVTSLVEPALEKSLGEISTLIEQPIKFANIKPFVPAAFAAACGLEIAGGVLFILGSRFGAFLLLLFLAAVTPVMHNFWESSLDEEQKLTQMVNFFKNTALIGALLFFMSMKGSAKAASAKAKKD